MKFQIMNQKLLATALATTAISALASLASVIIPTNVLQAQALPYGPDTCKNGYVWREAISSDHVCVTPQTRSATAYENSLARSRVEPNSGAFGPNTCRQGYVWRQAFSTDAVCVTPASRDRAASDNASAEQRKASNQ
jgi:hypothetical protein